MSSWNKLATEILSLVLENLSNGEHSSRNFMQCLLVCKHWYNLTITYLYKEVGYLDQHRMIEFIQCLKLNHQGRVVESIELGFHYKSSSGLLEEIAILCPNLKHISSTRSQRHRFWKDLGQVSDQFKKLESLPSTLGATPEEFYTCISKYKSSIKTLELPDIDPYYDGGKKLIQNLGEFRLRSLILNEVPGTLIKLDDIVNSCPLLNDLVVRPRGMMVFPSVMFSIVPTDIQRLSIGLDFNMFGLDYIQLKFPHLVSLKVDLYSTEDDFDERLPSCLDRFTQYAMQIPDYTINFWKIPHMITQKLPYIMPLILQQNPALQVTFFHSRLDIYEPGIELKMSRQRNSLHIRCCDRDAIMTLWSFVSQYLYELDVCVWDWKGEGIENFIDIVVNCSKIKNFKFVKDGTFCIPEANGQHHVLESLELVVTEIVPITFTTFSRWFTHLRVFSVKTRFNQTFALNMPYTDLDTIKLDLQTHSTNSMVRITTNKKVWIFLNNGEPLIDIHCASINSVQLIVNSIPLNLPLT
ncbi:hypothetical protein G6F56_007749 [Rhizopus delemar]|nr:hypothetical protein G6F56_007749 [Rhizopus delemar]